LLSNGSDLELKIKEVLNNYTIQNLSLHQVKTREDTLRLIQKGNHLKKIRETNLNESSSRSHIVFTLYLEKIDHEGKPIKCKFNLVDLAGSEKVFKSKVQGEGLE
jgi:mannose/fructose/N-acetylgalactosamine-specific phosphotransferase system component IIB